MWRPLQNLIILTEKPYSCEAMPPDDNGWVGEHAKVGSGEESHDLLNIMGCSLILCSVREFIWLLSSLPLLTCSQSVSGAYEDKERISKLSQRQILYSYWIYSNTKRESEVSFPNLVRDLCPISYRKYFIVTEDTFNNAALSLLSKSHLRAFLTEYSPILLQNNNDT
jgi:hypothetical protein